MNLVDVGQELAAQLGTILDGRATVYPPDRISAPAGFVFDPDTTYDQTYERGMDTVLMSLTVLVARQPLETAWKQLAAYVSGSGDKSVKACIEAGTYTSFDSVTVTGSQIGDTTAAGGDYKAAVFDLQIVGSGS